MTLQKPSIVASNAFKSAKWDEITSGRDFQNSDAPTLALLCQWHLVAQQCMEDIDNLFDGNIAYENRTGDIKEIPQISTMERASREIRQLNKQLGIIDTAENTKVGETGANVLTLLNGNRANRRANAANKNRAVGM